LLSPTSSESLTWASNSSRFIEVLKEVFLYVAHLGIN
jgi:hypothetical protein